MALLLKKTPSGFTTTFLILSKERRHGRHNPEISPETTHLPMICLKLLSATLKKNERLTFLHSFKIFRATFVS